MLKNHHKQNQTQRLRILAFNSKNRESNFYKFSNKFNYLRKMAETEGFEPSIPFWGMPL